MLKGELIMLRPLILALALVSLGCSSSDEPENTRMDASIEGTQVEMQNAARLLTAGFMGSLKTELMKAVKEGGFESAIGACQIKAPQVADSYSREAWSIKRVTEKPRNVLNKADLHEQEVLGLFADSLKNLRFHDEWTDPQNQTGYTYYQPIEMGALCLYCHGRSSSIDEKVTLAIQDKYPDDKAVDYMAGDLRGMFVVHIKDLESVALLRQALPDSL